jgi:hypothetical protein
MEKRAEEEEAARVAKAMIAEQARLTMLAACVGFCAHTVSSNALTAAVNGHEGQVESSSQESIMEEIGDSPSSVVDTLISGVSGSSTFDTPEDKKTHKNNGFGKGRSRRSTEAIFELQGISNYSMSHVTAGGSTSNGAGSNDIAIGKRDVVLAAVDSQTDSSQVFISEFIGSGGDEDDDEDDEDVTYARPPIASSSNDKKRSAPSSSHPTDVRKKSNNNNSSFDDSD